MHGYDGGTVLDAVPASAPSGLRSGGRGDTVTLWPPGEAVPTADHPALAVVLTPTGAGSGAGTPATGTDATGAAGGTAPTWVFPFDRPLPPGASDNQALAVNTADGTVRYAVSFALVWATGDTALQRNEAYALASCTGCSTVAVAFQVVLVLGSVHVVAPQNLSAAVTYGCVGCLAYAAAQQLVLSVPDRLGEQDSRDLAAVWASLAAFGRDLQDVPLAEIQDRLRQYEQQITDIVERSAAPAATPAATPSDTPPDSSTAAPSSTPTATPAGSEESAASTTGTADRSTASAATVTAAPAGSTG